ncbi:hypothetical protein [Paenarthrobacter ureafaciens]
MNAASKSKQGPKQLLVIQVLAAKPEYSSKASLQDLALLCGTDPATVTRAARTLGFDGWAALRSEIKVRLHSETPEKPLCSGLSIEAGALEGCLRRRQTHPRPRHDH